MGVNSYRALRVWQLGMELAKDVYKLTGSFPRHETYGLGSQIQRAAVSVPANIAEGHDRDSTKEYARHVSIAQGSLAELETHLLLTAELEYCASSAVTPLLDKCRQQSRMLGALRRSLRAKIQRGQLPLSPDL